MKIPRNLLLIAFAVVIAAQMGLAQTTAVGVHQQLLTAISTGKAQPVVPANSVPAGFARPHVWIADLLGGGTPNALPTFCNKFNSSGKLNICPNGMKTAYGTGNIIGANGGAGITIGIVDAFNYPDLQATLDQFDSDMGLPACNAGNGCLTILNENGGSTITAGFNSGWAVETALDVQWAHAMAPNAKILLVEGDTNSGDDLFTAELTAQTLADTITNSWGFGGEFVGEDSDDFLLNVNIPTFFSSGDSGAPTQWPCSSPFVTCVGGTTLTLNTTTLARASETAWAGSGGGCSAIELIPGYQSTYGVTTCGSFRGTPDIAADADPNTGAIVALSGAATGVAGINYFRVGGTSLASPMMAATYADIMSARVSFGKSKFGQLGGPLYQAFHNNYKYFYFDVTVGNNTNTNSPSCCFAGPGYDLVTGLGVPNGPDQGNRFFGIVYNPPPPE